MSSFSFKDNLTIDNNKYIKWLDSTGTSRSNVLTLDSNNNVVLNPSFSDLYINSSTGNARQTFLNVNNSTTSNVFIGSKLGVGFSTTSDVVANLTIVKNGFIGTNTTQGANDGFLGIVAGSSLSNTTGARIVLHGNDTATGGNIHIHTGNGASGRIRFFTGASESSERLQILSNGSVNFIPNGSSIRLAITDADTQFTNVVRISNTTDASDISTGSLLVLGGVSISKRLFVDGTISSGTLSIVSITGSNLNVTNTISSAAIITTNISCSNISSINLTTNVISSAALVATGITGNNVVVTGTISTSTLAATTITGASLAVSGNISANTLVATTITGANIAISTTVSAANLRATLVSASTVVGTTFTGGSFAISGVASAGTLVATTITGASLAVSTASASTLVATTITGANMSISTTVSAANLRAGLLNATSGITTGTFLATSTANLSFNCNTVGAIITTGGNVGIGLTNPSALLDVNGASKFRNLQFINPDTSSSRMYVFQGYNTTGGTQYWNIYNIPNGTGNASGVFKMICRRVDSSVQIMDLVIKRNYRSSYAVQMTGSNYTSIDSNGNNLNVLVYGDTSTTGGSFDVWLSVGGFSMVSVEANAYNGTVYDSSNFVSTAPATSGSYSLVYDGASNSSIVQSSFGATSGTPVTTISLGNLIASGLISSASLFGTNFTSTNATITQFANLRGDTNTIGSIFTTGGNVGIGTTSPQLNLDIIGTALGIRRSNVSPWDHLYISINNSESSIRVGGGQMAIDVGNGATGGYGGQTYNRVMTLLSTGSVGIGTTNPVSTLDVVGTANISTSISTGLLNATNSTIINLSVTGVLSSGTLNSTSISTNNLNASNMSVSSLNVGSLLSNGVAYGVSSIFSGSFIGANGVSNASVTGLSFTSTRSFYTHISVSITRSAGGNLYEYFTLEGNQNDSGWTLFTSSVGDVSGIGFTIDNTGQVLYTSTSQPNWLSTTLRFSVTRISDTGNYNATGNASSGALLVSSLQVNDSTNAALGSSNGSFYCFGGIGVARNLIVQSNTSSTNSSTGAIVVSGGISINDTTAATNVSSGGALTVAGGIAVAKNAIIGGVLSKGGGSFDIEHPDPAKRDKGYRLRHCFVESPTRGDNIYTYKVVIDRDMQTFQVELPEYFKHLNENPRTYISYESTFALSRCSARVTDDLTKVEGICEHPGLYVVMVIGTRTDQVMIDYFDNNGGVEYKKQSVI